MSAAKLPRAPQAVAALLAGAALAWFAAVRVPRMVRERAIGHGERAAVEALRRAAEIQRGWRLDDPDGNALPDNWTGDWSGLHRALGADGRPVDRLEAALAAADASPLPPSAHRGTRPALGDMLAARPWNGYWFRALRTAGGRPLAADGPDADANAWENLGAWGFAASPAEYGTSGRLTFVAREDGRVWARDLGPGAPPPADWPEGDPAAGWTEVR